MFAGLRAEGFGLEALMALRPVAYSWMARRFNPAPQTLNQTLDPPPHEQKSELLVSLNNPDNSPLYNIIPNITPCKELRLWFACRGSVGHRAVTGMSQQHLQRHAGKCRICSSVGYVESWLWPYLSCREEVD